MGCNVREDLSNYLVKNFNPLEVYINDLNKKIDTKISAEYDIGCNIEYLDKSGNLIKVFVNTVNENDIFISFYIYDGRCEVREMVDFLLRQNGNNVVRYSAVFYDNSLAYTINSAHSYHGNVYVSGWKNKYVLSKEDGHRIATMDNLANQGIHIKRENNYYAFEEEKDCKTLQLHF